MTVVETLKSVLCDPDGKCCIGGSPADRDIVDVALVNLETEISELKRQIAVFEANEARFIAADKSMQRQLTESQAREARLVEALTDVGKMLFDGQQGFDHEVFAKALVIALKRDDTALKEYHDSIVEKCSVIAGNSCLVLPDGGTPTVEEAAVSEEAARRIRKLKGKQ